MAERPAYKVCNVMLSVALVAVFVTMFFFTYVSNVESEIVQLQMGRIVAQTLTPVAYMLQPSALKSLQTAVDAYKPPNMDDADKAVKKNNTHLFT